jgi:hypothetical protein
MREAAAKLNNFPAKEIAQEITRILLDLFLAVAVCISPRYYTALLTQYHSAP